MNYFQFDESPDYADKFMIGVNVDALPSFHGMRGSFNVFIARVLNLSFPDYCRYCRDRLGAEVIGKGHLYPMIYFNKTTESLMLLKLLNKRMEYIMKGRNLTELEKQVKIINADE